MSTKLCAILCPLLGDRIRRFPPACAAVSAAEFCASVTLCRPNNAPTAITTRMTATLWLVSPSTFPAHGEHRDADLGTVPSLRELGGGYRVCIDYAVTYSPSCAYQYSLPAALLSNKVVSAI